MIGLTPRQRDVLAFIKGYRAREGVAPTLREIAARFRFRGPTALGHVRALEKKGYLRRARGRVRGIEVVDLEASRPPARVPIYGVFSQLAPLEAAPDYEELELASVAPPGRDLFVLRVRGNALAGSGIVDGDLLIIDRTTRAPAGAIVLALVNGSDAVLGRCVREAGAPPEKAQSSQKAAPDAASPPTGSASAAAQREHLEPLSSPGVAIRSSKVLVQGVLVAVVRRF